MSTQIAIGRITIPSAIDTSGTFSGQNMQSNWDAHTCSFSALTGIMGDHCVIDAGFVRCIAIAKSGTPIYDNDNKLNLSPMQIR